MIYKLNVQQLHFNTNFIDVNYKIKQRKWDDINISMLFGSIYSKIPKPGILILFIVSSNSISQGLDFHKK